MSIARRCNVHLTGPEGAQPMIFAHGFGCDQNMWRFVAPRFREQYRVVTFDWTGAGGSDVAAYDPQRYSTLDGYAQDLLALCHELDLHDVIYVGHSVAAMIGVLAAKAEPELFAGMVLVGPSPRYVDDGEYRGGFSEADIAELLDSLDSNYLGWSAQIAPVIMGNGERPELGDELTASFCRTDPAIARNFARATFLSDNRADLPHVHTPTLVLQTRQDVIAPVEIGQYVAEHMPGATMVLLDATGHCPNLSAPEQTTAAIADFLPRVCWSHT